jgi:hypothetical protein
VGRGLRARLAPRNFGRRAHWESLAIALSVRTVHSGVSVKDSRHESKKVGRLGGCVAADSAPRRSRNQILVIWGMSDETSNTMFLVDVWDSGGSR